MSLVLYYSKTDSTKTIANFIASLTHADVIQVEPTEPYPEDYHQTTVIAKKEINKGYLRPIKTPIPDVSKYNKVFIGSPCWWSTIAPPLKTLLTQIDLSGKTIAVFETNLGSGMGDVEKDVKALFPKSTFKPGIALWGSSVSGDKKKIEEWLTENSML